MLALLLQWSMGRGMLEYVNTRDAGDLAPVIGELATLYKQDDSWQALRQKPNKLKLMLREHQLLRPYNKVHHPLHEESSSDFKRSRDLRSLPKRIDIALLDRQGGKIVSINLRSKNRITLPIEVSGNIVGSLSIPQRKKLTEGFELRFLEQQKEMLILISFIVLIITMMASLPLARHFVKPIKRLNKGTNALTNGNYSFVLPEDRHDELGELARDFNQLAKTLYENDSSRKRWLADISHELRTPLAILSGEIEAMSDGVRELSQSSLQSLKEEADHLGKLVDDLYELTKADIGGLSYRKTDIDLVVFLPAKMDAYRRLFNEHKLNVCWQCSTNNVHIWADATRLHQLLDNLLTNACRYTNSGGDIILRLEKNNTHATIIIEDSAPGVVDEALGKLFDHLFRAESSRNRESGGSGLGLAICKRIVEAHDGSIKASHSSLGGVAIAIALPLVK